LGFSLFQLFGANLAIINFFLAHKLGSPLQTILIQQQHLEANYRFALTRFGES